MPWHLRRGITLIELCITIAIAGILFAMVLGLAKHVDAITKIRRAQAELGQWHDALDRWFIQFGEYPCFGDDRENPVCLPSIDASVNNLANMTNSACARIEGSDGSFERIYFRSYVSGAPSTIDPWGVPYVCGCYDDDPYDGVTNPRIRYVLFSCGPNMKTRRDDVYPAIIINNGDEKSANDDVYFE